MSITYLIIKKDETDDRFIIETLKGYKFSLRGNSRLYNRVKWAFLHDLCLEKLIIAKGKGNILFIVDGNSRRVNRVIKDNRMKVLKRILRSEILNETNQSNT